MGRVEGNAAGTVFSIHIRLCGGEQGLCETERQKRTAAPAHTTTVKDARRGMRAVAAVRRPTDDSDARGPLFLRLSPVFVPAGFADPFPYTPHRRTCQNEGRWPPTAAKLSCLWARTARRQGGTLV